MVRSTSRKLLLRTADDLPRRLPLLLDTLWFPSVASKMSADVQMPSSASAEVSRASPPRVRYRLFVFRPCSLMDLCCHTDSQVHALSTTSTLESA
ncbi:hypothetical protein B0J15DRAFT_504566 [Fusarium solani]|uniref:Uncharacterized protein n=1 Tax=Fusarium solani TaxID=169388 RepID=A0A9P9JUY1_FUSSL|nr:uncharacterized protein B0J15DRAFT_504566 [Fusarium solani]KAH7234251.1 hypothetical protein B0J15DRAFT_504566 [Fusarium solani]